MARTESGRERGRRAPQGHRLRPLLSRIRVEHDGERCRNDQGGAGSLDRSRCDENADRRRGSRERRGCGEHDHASDVDPSATEDVCEATRRYQQRGERDVVGVQHPRKLGNGYALKRTHHVRKSDADDRVVDEGHEQPKRGDNQDDCGRDPATPHAARGVGRVGGRVQRGGRHYVPGTDGADQVSRTRVRRYRAKPIQHHAYRMPPLGKGRRR